MGLREDKKRELRARILSTTLSLFGERGFVGTRVADIAAALRISEATFFNYFPTKQAVLKSAVRDGLDRAVERVLAGADDPAERDAAARSGAGDVVRAIGAEVAEVFDTKGTLMRLLAHQSDVLAAGFLATWPPPESVIAMFATAQERGDVRSDLAPEFLARGLLATLGAAVCAAVEASPVAVSTSTVSTGTVSTGTVSTGTVSTGAVSTGAVSTDTVSTGTVSTGEGGPAAATSVRLSIDAAIDLFTTGLHPR